MLQFWEDSRHCLFRCSSLFGMSNCWSLQLMQELLPTSPRTCINSGLCFYNPSGTDATHLLGVNQTLSATAYIVEAFCGDAPSLECLELVGWTGGRTALLNLPAHRPHTHPVFTHFQPHRRPIQATVLHICNDWCGRLKKGLGELLISWQTYAITFQRWINTDRTEERVAWAYINVFSAGKKLSQPLSSNGGIILKGSKTKVPYIVLCCI